MAVRSDLFAVTNLQQLDANNKITGYKILLIGFKLILRKGMYLREGAEDTT